MDDARDPLQRVDLAAPLEILEAGKEISREESFGDPDRLASPQPAKTDARGEDFEPEFTLENQGDLVFQPGCSVKAIPVQLEEEGQRSEARGQSGHWTEDRGQKTGESDTAAAAGGEYRTEECVCKLKLQRTWLSIS